MVRIKDIAEKAGVSSATVSRVLNHDPNLSVTQTTRQLIFQTAQELGYEKRGKKTPPKKSQIGTIAIVEWYTKAQELDDLYYYSIRIGVEKRAQEMGYSLVRIFNNDSFHTLSGIKGIVAIGKFSSQKIQELETYSKQIVFIDSNTLRYGHSCVTTDFENSVIAVLDYFLKHGHVKIGMLAGQECTSDDTTLLLDSRLSTFRNYLSQKGLLQEDWIKIGFFTAEAGYQMMAELLREHPKHLPSALFLANDTLALGALRALQEASIAVPTQISLVAFNDTSISKYVYPPLSSVTVYTEEMGKAALELLHQELEKEGESIPQMMTLSTSLTIRESSCPYENL
ncbi:LacI family DNA-binding transcriptional regulator [Streptococcus himalayensis]|uniref:LacI family transcriptional regulator n=1 Tax=Streptococcus himalayensis TaxID=1888195 RepID=A0A917A4J6_9STRE|nr:LacI family DNA-binding transcriptional regulator [Streptococcus himalayensis]GGE25515.1 LacI family transcriptional regulator [Streptococcus himalayensis]